MSGIRRSWSFPKNVSGEEPGVRPHLQRHSGNRNTFLPTALQLGIHLGSFSAWNDTVGAWTTTRTLRNSFAPWMA